MFNAYGTTHLGDKLFLYCICPIKSKTALPTTISYTINIFSGSCYGKANSRTDKPPARLPYSFMPPVLQTLSSY